MLVIGECISVVRMTLLDIFIVCHFMPGKRVIRKKGCSFGFWHEKRKLTYCKCLSRDGHKHLFEKNLVQNSRSCSQDVREDIIIVCLRKHILLLSKNLHRVRFLWAIACLLMYEILLLFLSVWLKTPMLVPISMHFLDCWYLWY